MMTLLFLSLAAIISIVVILVSAKFIKAGFDARSEVRDQKQTENLYQEVQDITNEDIEDDPQKGAILNQLDDYLIILDKYKNIKYLNPSAKNKFGKESLGKHIATILRVPDLLQNVDLVVNKRKTINMDLELSQPSFQFFKVYIMIGESIFSDDPDTINLFLKDYTEIVKAQKFKSDFVANVSHELKTPLVSIKGFLETINGHAKNDPEAQKKFIPIMLEQADRMENLIKDLLSLSKIELEEHIQPQDKVNLKEIFNSVEDIHQNKLLNFKFTNKIQSDFFVKGNFEALVDIFSNLIDNSIKYSENKKSIEIKIEKGDGKLLNNSYKISISDQGIGIPAEHVSRITERFYRVDAKKSREVGGTGLGLAICRHRIIQHRGELEIKSKVGEGTQISVHLPVF